MKNERKSRILAALAGALLAAGTAYAASPIVIDNVAPQFATTGTWPTSTAVTISSNK